MKRNVGKHTDQATAELRILRVLRTYGTFIRANKSQLGRVAFPDYSFKSPQGAAFSVAKIVRSLCDRKLVGEDFREHGQSGYYLRPEGVKELNRLLTPEGTAPEQP